MSRISLKRTSCCGLRIVSGQSETPKESLLYICAKMYREDYDAAFVLFSDNSEHGNGMKRLILKNKLGNIKEENDIWIWECNNRITLKWFDKNS